MSKQSKKDRHSAKDDLSANKMNKVEDQQVSNDRSFRHISEIDCREGEMQHGETGGFKERPSAPDNGERA